MVKPGMPYLDVVRLLRDTSPLPVAVSGKGQNDTIYHLLTSGIYACGFPTWRWCGC